MAALILSAELRAQFAAIARVRWQLFVNSLRTIRGRLEFVSRIFLSVWFGVAGVGGAAGLGIAAWYLVSRGELEWLQALLWPVFLFWQLFPLMATAFTENFDSSNLLRFPLSYRSYFAIRLVYGSLDATTALGLFWTLAITIGIGVAAPALILWTAIVPFAFAALNILLGRMIFAWIERWLAQRRTREILGVVFFLLIFSFQLVGPLVGRYGHRPLPAVLRIGALLLPLERLLPPGLASVSVSRAVQGEFLASVGAFALLGVYCLGTLGLLHARLRAQYRGEYLSDAAARRAAPAEKQPARLGWSLPGLSGGVTAILEKEFRYLSRSGPMLFTLIVPVFVLFVFRLTPASSGENFISRIPDFAFPIGAAYSLLTLTNFVYNSFGAEGAGVQFYFVSPVRFRDVLLAKNLTHGSVLALETLLVWLAVCFLFKPPSPAISIATIAAILFGLLANLSVGNLLSLHSPKKIDYGTFGRQRASQLTVFASLGVQIGIFGLGGLALAQASVRGRIWVATIVFMVLAAAAMAGYSIVLSRADRIALSRRETLISELSRA